MSYGDFNVRKIIDDLGYRVEEQHFLIAVERVAPSARLLSAIGLLREVMVFGSEKSRSEAFIAPILSEAASRTHTRLFSGETFEVDAARGLNGQVDFLFARRGPGKTIIDPVFCVVEAKKADIDSNAYGQCMAEMIAAQKFNRSPRPIYGGVTTGSDWQFLRLRDDLVELDPETYFEKDLELLLGILVSFLRAP